MGRYTAQDAPVIVDPLTTVAEHWVKEFPSTTLVQIEFLGTYHRNWGVGYGEIPPEGVHPNQSSPHGLTAKILFYTEKDDLAQTYLHGFFRDGLPVWSLPYSDPDEV